MKKKCTIREAKNKGADQLRGTAPLFSHMSIVGFLTRWLKYLRSFPKSQLLNNTVYPNDD